VAPARDRRGHGDRCLASHPRRWPPAGSVPALGKKLDPREDQLVALMADEALRVLTLLVIALIVAA
jgi:hypothetical protein